MPAPLDDCKGGLCNSRFIPASDDHRKCGNLCLQLLELLFKVCILKDLDQGMLKLFGIGQRDRKNLTYHRWNRRG